MCPVSSTGSEGNVKESLPLRLGAHPFGLTRSLNVMLCAAIDVGSNTTRVLVAEPQEGQLRKVMEQRAYTRIGRRPSTTGRSMPTRWRRSRRSWQRRFGSRRSSARMRSEQSRRRRSARRRTAPRWSRRSPGSPGSRSTSERARGGAPGVPRRHEDARPPGRGRDRGGRRRWRLVGGRARHRQPRGCARSPRSRSVRVRWPTTSSPTTPPRRPRSGRARPHRRLLRGVELEQPGQAVAVGGSATSLRTLVGAVLEYETLERAIRVLTGARSSMSPSASSSTPDAFECCRPGSSCWKALRAPGPAAPDRKGRAARGRHPGAFERRHQRRAASSGRLSSRLRRLSRRR